jgi:hypothetical protein
VKAQPPARDEPASKAKPSGRAKVTGESRKAERSDIGRRVEVLRSAGSTGWYGGTIRGFNREQFRVEYDDGSEVLEALAEGGETFFPDPAEETQCQKPPKLSELVLVHDPHLKMALVCRVVGARPDGGRRVRFVGWSRQNDLTCWAKGNSASSGGAYLLEMTASNKEKAMQFNRQINKVDKAQGDAGRARVGSKVTAVGLSDEQRVWDVAIRQTSPKSDCPLLYLLADMETWVPENSLLTVDGRALKSSNPTPKPARDAVATDEAGSAQSGEAAKAISPTVKQPPQSLPAKGKPEVLLVAAYEEDWDDLSTAEREAARFLGWSAAQWDACEDPPSRAQLWDEMAVEQREAAAVLGWDSTRWGPMPTETSR